MQVVVATLGERAQIIAPGMYVEPSGPATVLPGTLVTLTIRYAAPGPYPQASVVISATLCPGLTYVGDDGRISMINGSEQAIVWPLESVPPNSVSSTVITASVGTDAVAGSTVPSTVHISGRSGWDLPQHDQATWTAFIVGSVYPPVWRRWHAHTRPAGDEWEQPRDGRLPFGARVAKVDGLTNRRYTLALPTVI